MLGDVTTDDDDEGVGGRECPAGEDEQGGERQVPGGPGSHETDAVSAAASAAGLVLLLLQDPLQPQGLALLQGAALRECCVLSVVC